MIFPRLSAFIIVMFFIFATGNQPSVIAMQEPRALLQYAVEGHAVGFGEGKVYIAGMDHLLHIQFLDGKDVAPDVLDRESAFEQVTYAAVWPNIDVVFTPFQGGIMESSYIIHPGGCLANIRISYNLPVELLSDGRLQFSYDSGYMIENAPIAWQEIDGRRVPVAVVFEVLDSQEVGFRVGSYNRDFPLLIDPGYSWHTFFGNASGSDEGLSIALDSSNNVYIIGSSTATWNGPGGTLPLDAHAGGVDIVVVKLSGTGAYQWHAFYGSSSDDFGGSIDVDGSGNVYLTGISLASWNGPGPTIPINAHAGVRSEIVVVKLSSSGVYQWHTFFGSTSYDYGYDIKVDGSGSYAYVVGESLSSWNGPGATIPLNGHSGGADIVIIQVSSAGAYQWHSFFGSPSVDVAHGVFVHGGSVYLTGESFATWDGPGATGALNAHSGGAEEIVLVKLTTAGVYQWHTFYGGLDSIDIGRSIAVDGSGYVYVTGESYASWIGPGSTAALNPYAGSQDIVVLKLAETGTYQWHTFYGGEDYDYGLRLALDGSANLYLTGYTNNTWNGSGGTLPLNPYTDNTDIFLLTISSSGAYRWHTFYGSADFDYGEGITLDGSGNVYITGGSSDWNGPASTEPLNPNSGSYDIVVIRTAATCYALTTDVNPTEGGTLEVSPAPFCNSGSQYPEGYQPTLTPTPASNYYRFLEWSGDASGSDDPLTIPITGTMTITANFEQATFADVPFDYSENLGGIDYLLHPYIESLWDGGYTAGCGTDPLIYCPGTFMDRAQSAVFMLRGQFGIGYAPPPEPWDTFFDDWSPGLWAEKWAEGMYAESLSAGCNLTPLLYCPWSQLSRVEASVFGLRLMYGSTYGTTAWPGTPPPATGTLFADMTDITYWGTKWAEQAYLDGLLPACGEQSGDPLFCPDDPVSRAWGAYLIVQAKSLPLP